MLVCTTWKARPLSTEQVNRMMQIWGKLEEAQATNPSVERLCWYIFGDGSGGLTVLKAVDVDCHRRSRPSQNRSKWRIRGVTDQRGVIVLRRRM